MYLTFLPIIVSWLRALEFLSNLTLHQSNIDRYNLFYSNNVGSCWRTVLTGMTSGLIATACLLWINVWLCGQLSPSKVLLDKCFSNVHFLFSSLTDFTALSTSGFSNSASSDEWVHFALWNVCSLDNKMLHFQSLVDNNSFNVFCTQWNMDFIPCPLFHIGYFTRCSCIANNIFSYFVPFATSCELKLLVVHLWISPDSYTYICCS